MNILTCLHCTSKEVLAISDSFISHSLKLLVLTEAWPLSSDIISPAVPFITVSISLPLVFQVRIQLEILGFSPIIFMHLLNSNAISIILDFYLLIAITVCYYCIYIFLLQFSFWVLYVPLFRPTPHPTSFFTATVGTTPLAVLYPQTSVQHLAVVTSTHMF